MKNEDEDDQIKRKRRGFDFEDESNYEFNANTERPNWDGNISKTHTRHPRWNGVHEFDNSQDRFRDLTENENKIEPMNRVLGGSQRRSWLSEKELTANLTHQERLKAAKLVGAKIREMREKEVENRMLRTQVKKQGKKSVQWLEKTPENLPVLETHLEDVFSGATGEDKFSELENLPPDALKEGYYKLDVQNQLFTKPSCTQKFAHKSNMSSIEKDPRNNMNNQESLVLKNDTIMLSESWESEWGKPVKNILNKAARMLNVNHEALKKQFATDLAGLPNNWRFKSEPSKNSVLNSLKLKIAFDNLKYSPDSTSGITGSYLAELSQHSKNRIFRIPEFKELLEIEAGKLYMEGKSYREIGRLIGASWKTVGAWFTRDQILDKHFFTSGSLNRQPKKPVQIDFDSHLLPEIAQKHNLREADFVLTHQNQIAESLLEFVKNSIHSLNYDIENISKQTGLSTNLLRDWLSLGRLQKEYHLKTEDCENIDVFEEKYVRADWAQLKKKLGAKGVSIGSITAKLGIHLTKQIKDNSVMLYQNFLRVTHHYGIDIQKDLSFTFEDKVVNATKDHTLKLPKNRLTAELVGIMLGDGHFRDEGSINLDLSQVLVRNNVNNVLTQVFGNEVFNGKPTSHNKYGFRSAAKRTLNGLDSLGIERGHKLENQISVPIWIMSNPQFQVECLKGMIDTDGSVFLIRKATAIGVNFTNKSIPLLDFVENYCKKMKIGYIREDDYYQVKVTRMEDVAKILELTRPLKLQEMYLTHPELVERYFPNFPDYKRPLERLGQGPNSRTHKSKRTLKWNQSDDIYISPTLKRRELERERNRIELVNLVERKKNSSGEMVYVSADWKWIQQELKSKGFTLRSINDEIGSNFRNQVFGDYNMYWRSFVKLIELLGHEPEYHIINPEKDYKPIRRDKNGRWAKSNKSPREV